MAPTQAVTQISALDEERHPVCSGHVETRTGREGDKGQVEEQKTKIRRDLGDQDARMIRDQVKSSV